MPETERVLAVPRARLRSAGLTSGAMLGEAAGIVVSTILKERRFIPRPEVERDTSLLQPIPCAVVTSGSSFLTLRRDEGRKEAPLHGKFVIWMGGHVRAEDCDGGDDFLSHSLRREIEEELAITVSQLEFLGIVSLPGSLHFAVIHHCPIAASLTSDVKPNGEFFTAKKRRSSLFLTVDELHAMGSRLDGWSRLALSDILQLTTYAKPNKDQLDLPGLVTA